MLYGQFWIVRRATRSNLTKHQTFPLEKPRISNSGLRCSLVFWMKGEGWRSKVYTLNYSFKKTRMITHPLSVPKNHQTYVPYTCHGLTNPFIYVFRHPICSKRQKHLQFVTKSYSYKNNITVFEINSSQRKMGMANKMFLRNFVFLFKTKNFYSSIYTNKLQFRIIRIIHWLPHFLFNGIKNGFVKLDPF